MPTIALAGTGRVAAMLTVAAQRLGWGVAALAGDESGPLADQTGAPVVELSSLLADPRADIVVVDTPAPTRAGDAVTLLARGANVVLAPGMSVDDARRVVDAEQRLPGSLIMGEVFPAAPVVQRWFAELAGLGDVTHLSGRAGGLDLDWPLLAVGVLSARAAGWGAPVDDGADAASPLRFASTDGSARLSFDDTADGSARHWELQAASPSSTLRVEMLPRPGSSGTESRCRHRSRTTRRPRTGRSPCCGRSRPTSRPGGNRSSTRCSR